MIIVEPSYAILQSNPLDRDAILELIERAGRTCYKSEERITPGSAVKFCRMIREREHESVIEHVSITVRFVIDRGVSHELVRHRLASYSQESTRYCNYGKARVPGAMGELTFIRPPFWREGDPAFLRWLGAMKEAEDAYLDLLAGGAIPEQARSVLPNSLKTEIVMTANLREWRHVFRLRTSAKAHPQIRQVMIPLRDELAALLPEIFEP